MKLCIDRPKPSEKVVTQTPPFEDKVPQVVQVKIEPEIEPEIEPKIEIKTDIKKEMIDTDYPNYMESIESVINASKEVMEPQPKPATVSNPLPHHDHQYSRINFYGSGESNETKAAPETIDNEPKIPSQPKVSACKQLNVKAQTVQKPRQQSHHVIRPKPIIYRFKPNNGLQQPSPAYFVPSTANTSSNMRQHMPTIIRTIPKPIPSIYANATMPLHFKTPVTILQRPMFQQPIYYLQFCSPKE